MQIKKWTLWSQDILTFTSFITLLKYFFKFFSSLVGKQVLFVLLYFQVRFFLSLSKWKKALIAQSCWTLWDPMDCSPPGSSVYGILQARILGWNAIPFSRGCSWLRDRTQVSCIADRFFTSWATKEASLTFSSVKFSSVTQSCPTLCNPMNCSTPGLPVHHQLQEFTQTHVHQVSDAIQPSHPLSSPSPPAPNPSQHQSLFQWVNSSHEVVKVLEFQL